MKKVAKGTAIFPKVTNAGKPLTHGGLTVFSSEWITNIVDSGPGKYTPRHIFVSFGPGIDLAYFNFYINVCGARIEYKSEVSKIVEFLKLWDLLKYWLILGAKTHHLHE